MKDDPSSWVSVHVFRPPPTDDLLLTLRPTVEALIEAGLVQGHFFLRYWEGGPHVRFRLRAAPAAATAVRQAIVQRLGSYLRDHPSRTSIDPVAYASLSAGLADFEGRDGYDTRLRTPDTIEFIDYHPEHESFGAGGSLAHVEQHFCESSTVALDVLAGPAADRLPAAMVMSLAFFLSLPSVEPTATAGAAARRRAAQGGGGRAVGFDRDGARRAWLASRDELGELAERLQSAGPDASTPLQAWQRSVRNLRDGLTGIHRAGNFAPGREDAVPHALHRCLHLHLNRMGISSRQEERLRYLALQTVKAGKRENRSDATPACG